MHQVTQVLFFFLGYGTIMLLVLFFFSILQFYFSSRLGWYGKATLNSQSRPCAFEAKMKMKSRPARNAPQKPQQQGDRGQLETACDETSSTR